MAKIVLEADTDTGVITATVNGKLIENLTDNLIYSSIKEAIKSGEQITTENLSNSK